MKEQLDSAIQDLKTAETIITHSDNMAATETVNNNCSYNVSCNNCVCGEELCVNCLSMKEHIQLLSTELKSAQLIIKILQEELKSTSMPNITSSMNSNPHVKNNSDCVSGSESGWVEIRRGNHKPKLQNNIPRF